MADNNVISFQPRLKEEVKGDWVDYSGYHDGLLEVMEEVFPDGAITIGFIDNTLSMGTTIEDIEVLQEMLETAIEMLKEQQQCNT